MNTAMNTPITEKCRRARKTLESNQIDRVVHHWDADGASSAALLLRSYRNIDAKVAVPTIGKYSVEAVLERINRGENIVILDYGVSGAEYDKLASLPSIRLIAAIDHHKVEPPSLLEAYCNPVAERVTESIPSCSLLVFQGFSKRNEPVDRLLAALGILGDLTPYYDSARTHPAIDLAGSLVSGIKGWDLRRLRKTVDLVDSSYRLIDYDCLSQITLTLAEDGPYGLEELECAVRNYNRSTGLISEAIRRLRVIASYGPCDLYELELEAYVTSLVGRRLASSNPGRIEALLHYSRKLNSAIAYMRSVERGLDPIRRLLQSKGVNYAGKKEVVVVQWPYAMRDKLREIITEAIAEACKDDKGRSA